MMELLKQFYDESKTKTIWKNGFVNNDGTCDVLVKYFDSAIELTVRIVDPKKLFNLDTDLHMKFAEFIFMDYNLHINYLLDKFNIPFMVQNLDKNSHPIFRTEPEVTANLENLLKFDRKFYRKILSHDHDEAFKNSNKTCAMCSLKPEKYKLMKEMFAKTYQTFDFGYFQTKTSATKQTRSLVEFDSTNTTADSFQSLQMGISDFKQTFNKFRVKFIDKDYSNFGLGLGIDIIVNENTINITVDLKKRNYNIYNGLNVKLIKTRCVKKASAEDTDKNFCVVRQNDFAGIELDNFVNIFLNQFFSYKR